MKIHFSSYSEREKLVECSLLSKEIIISRIDLVIKTPLKRVLEPTLEVYLINYPFVFTFEM